MALPSGSVAFRRADRCFAWPTVSGRPSGSLANSPSEAQELLRRALDVLESGFGPDNHDVVASRHTVLAIPATIKALQTNTAPNRVPPKPRSPHVHHPQRPHHHPDALRRGTLTGSNVNEHIEPDDDVQVHKFGNVNETVESDDDVEGHARWKNADESDKA